MRDVDEVETRTRGPSASCCDRENDLAALSKPEDGAMWGEAGEYSPGTPLVVFVDSYHVVSVVDVGCVCNLLVRRRPDQTPEVGCRAVVSDLGASPARLHDRRISLISTRNSQQMQDGSKDVSGRIAQ
ncbi:hypothetical protein AB1N83_003843 [Pleurotus pulmonarius]